ncbi:MAG: leucine-rich repeat protein [Bacteroidaceae bacterium]|nr:leucine-rich repeat protein [Bacteroidaceae bacterium]
MYNGNTYKVTSIGNKAFSSRKELSSVDIPNSVTIINEYAFSGCSNLVSIAIPSSVIKINDNAFNSCTSLKELRIEDSETTLSLGLGTNSNGYQAGLFCHSPLTSIYLGRNLSYDSNQNKGYSPFYNKQLLTSLTIGNCVTGIGTNAFYKCSGLTSVIIPNNVTIINSNAFSGCSNLNEILYVSITPPKSLWLATSTYVSNKETYSKSTVKGGSGEFIEYITFEQNEFSYNGQEPSVNYTNNWESSDELTMNIVNLQKEAGTYETVFKAIYSNGLEVDIPYTYTINKTPLTIQVNDAEKIYGDENPEFTYSFSGFVNNEDESVLSSAVAFSTKANKKSGAGTYSVSANATAKNYEIGCTEGTLTVKKAPVTVAVNAKSRVYGDANPQFDFTYVGLKNGDGVPVFASELSTSTKATKYSAVGDYEVTVSGGVATNYSFTEYIFGTLTVTQAPLNISVQSTVREYGEANPEFKFAYSGFKNDDDADCLATAPTVVTSATPTSSVGEYEITPNGAEATNYAINYTSGTLTVNKAPLTIQAEAAERVYGDENPKFTFAYSGFKNEETYDVLTNRPSAKTEAIATSAVGTYEIVPSGAEAQNYDITYKNGALTVTKASLSVSAVSAQKEYGEANPAIALTYSGFKNNDNEDCISEKPAIAVDADKKSDVGEYAITVSGGKAQNYAFTEYNEGVLNVVKAPLSVIAENKERLYFEANPEFTYYCEGFKNDDAKDVITTEPSFECSAKQTSSVGEYEITLSGAEAKNYELSYQGAMLTVGKRTIDVKVGDYTRVYGEENPDFSVSYSGFVNNESEKVFTAMPTLNCIADKTTDVGTYEITASGAEAANYDFNYTSGTLTIEKATQEIVWEQNLEEVEIGDQVELTALATSGLDIEYEIADNNFVSIYEAAGKVYLDCFGVGQIVIKAIQSGNKNYHSAVRVSKKLIVTDPSGIEDVVNDASDSPIYNIKGERMSCERRELQKGIYIQNGKKFIVK